MNSALLVRAGSLLVLLFHRLLCRFTLVKVVIWRYEFVPLTTLIATLFLFPLQNTHTHLSIQINPAANFPHHQSRLFWQLSCVLAHGPQPYFK